MLVDKIPDQDETVVASRRKDAASIRRPFHTVQGGGVALELEKSLSGLPHIKYTDDAGVLGERGQEMGVVRRGCYEVSELRPVNQKMRWDMIIPAILNSGGGQMPDCDGPDGLELPGLITAVDCISIDIIPWNETLLTLLGLF